MKKQKKHKLISFLVGLASLGFLGAFVGLGIVFFVIVYYSNQLPDYRQLATYEPMASRGRLEQVGELMLIDDTYNASPDSMKSGAQVMLSLEGKRHIAVFADVLELGEASEHLHREVGAYLAELVEQDRKTDLLVTVGTQAAFIADEAKKHGLMRVMSVTSNAEAAEYLRSILASGDVVLVKGSRGMHTEEILKEFCSL